MIRQSRAVRSPTAALRSGANAGLTLFVRTDALPDDWVRLVLAEKEIDSARLEWIHAGDVNEDFLTLNPEGTLPTLADRDGVVTGASIIAEYLDERYPHPPLMPLGPAPRAQVRMLMARLESELFPLIADAAVRRKPLEFDALVSAFRMRRRRGTADFSVLDCAWAAILGRLHRLGVELPAHVAGLHEYARSLTDRPSFCRTFPT